ncbi:MAG: STAS domain-containing protein [Treponema sp.]|jgi:anti-sigma B factor antagonist|nr:STAS domain-containing protein [Treponema sp.]
MGIRIRTNQLIYIIDLEGSLDLYESNRLKELVMKMIEKKVERFILNLRDIEALDSSGIGAFIYISSTIKKMNLGLAMANVRGPVRDIIEKTKLMNYFPIYEKMDDAIQALSDLA